MRSVASVTLAAAGLLFAAALSPAAANEANFQPFLIGDRAIGMGGAFTALATDGSATYYNPAGLAVGSGLGLALSLPLYGYVYRVIPRALALPPAGASAEVSGSFVTVPSTFVLSHRFGVPDAQGARPDAVAWSILVPDYASYSGQAQISDGAQTRIASFTDQDQTLWIGPSYAHHYSDRLSFGGSFFIAYRSRHVTTATDDVMPGPPTSFFHFENQVSLSTFELLVRLGVLYHLSRFTNLGVVLMAPSLHVYGSGSLSAIEAVSDPSTGTSRFINPSQQGLGADSHTPAELRLGIAHRFTSYVISTADVELHAPTHYGLLQGANPAYESAELLSVFAPSVHIAPVIDVNLGSEVTYAKNWPFRFGAFTDLSGAGTPQLDPTGPTLAHEDRFGATFSVGIHRQSFAIDVGMEYAYSFGSGPVAANTQALAIEPFHEHAVFFYVSGIESLEHALTHEVEGWVNEAVQKVERPRPGAASQPATAPASASLPTLGPDPSLGD